MERTTLTLLGGLDVRRDTGSGVILPTAKYRALLAFLAVPPGLAHPRDKLAALLWGDLPREKGRAALRQAVFAIRRALDSEAAPALDVASDVVALRPDAVWVDVAEFERCAARGTRESLERAVRLYGGDFLAGLRLDEEPFEEWLTIERQRLAELAVEVLARLLGE